MFFEKDELHMIAVKSISVREQVFNTYGDIGNSELLFKYGYLDDPNPFTNVEIHIQDVNTSYPSVADSFLVH